MTSSENNEQEPPETEEPPCRPLGLLGTGERRVGDAGTLRATLAPDVLKAGFYLRERDLTCFAVEDWLPKHAESMTDASNRCAKPVRYTPEIRCVRFGEEIPCLYFVRLNSTQENPPIAAITSDFLSLVEVVSSTTGGGVGIVIDPTNRGRSQLSTDDRTGRRVRYSITKFPQVDNKEEFYWVERTQTGRSRGFPGGSSIPTL